MMTTREIQDEIIRLKKENDICILAHAYQNHNILEVADYTGDSYGLSVQASKSSAGTVLMCGVRFMAETVKILSPDKKVILSNPGAGCPMAEQLDVSLLKTLREKYPEHTVVAYINTTSELKTLCDVCVTSSSAVQIIKNIDNGMGTWKRRDTCLWDRCLCGGCNRVHYGQMQKQGKGCHAWRYA